MAEKSGAAKKKKKPFPFKKGGSAAPGKAAAGDNKTPGKNLPPWLKGKDDR